MRCGIEGGALGSPSAWHLRHAPRGRILHTRNWDEEPPCSIPHFHSVNIHRCHAGDSSLFHCTVADTQVNWDGFLPKFHIHEFIYEKVHIQVRVCDSNTLSCEGPNADQRLRRSTQDKVQCVEAASSKSQTTVCSFLSSTCNVKLRGFIEDPSGTQNAETHQSQSHCGLLVG
jgi:hypothetical protein